MCVFFYKIVFLKIIALKRRKKKVGCVDQTQFPMLLKVPHLSNFQSVNRKKGPSSEEERTEAMSIHF